MHTEKKRSKEDTWKAADLKRYIAEGSHEDGRRGDRGESLEKHYKESRRERDKHREYYTGGRVDADEMYRHVERRKEGSQDRRDDRERNRIEERLMEKERRRERDTVDMNSGEHIKKTDRRRRDREETQERERDRQRQREKDKVRDKYTDEERVRRRQEREKEVRREEGDREYKHYRDRRSHESIDKGGSEYTDKYNRERRERHRERERQGEEYGISRSEKERRERHAERKQSEHKEGKDYQDDRRKDKHDRERRHKEQRHHDEKQKHHSESREHRDRKRTEEEVRHHRSDREAEGDKHTERRHKEEKDPKEHFKERTQEMDKELQQTNSSHTQKAEETKIVNEKETEQEYEDDFEEYEDDFEELDESDNEDGEKEELVEHKEELSLEKREEIKAIQRAMDEENKKVGALSRQNTTEIKEERPKWSRESETTESQTPQRGKFMDFVAAKQREVNKKVASKQKKRSAELLRLIDLDFTLTSSLLDLPPVNEYEMYIRSFGTANTKQAYVQCNEDNADRDIQTEEIELTEKWTQHPPEHSGACGGENLFLYDFDFGIYILSLFSDPNISPKTRDGPLNELNIDSKRLTTFLQSASQVLIVLLEEDEAERNSLRKLRTQTDDLSFSDGGLQLNTNLPFLQGHHISLIHFSEVQKHTMISVHTSTTKPSAVLLGNHTLICIWNIWEPSRPQKILLYESEVQCCCFSPGKATLVFAGTTVGSVVLWDLREHTSNHYQMTIGDDEWTFRHPSFSTDAVMSASGHFSTVMSVEVVPSAVARGQRSEVSLLAPKEATGLSFQLASLDESGILNFWVVVELPKTNVAGSPTDLGLRPGGKVKLLHSSTLSVVDRMLHRAKKSAHLQMLRLKFLPTDSNHFFIGTNMGTVHHGTSHGLKALPKFYRDLEGNEKPVDINSISFSPFRQDLFLVGCGDGCIRLHSVSQEKPLIEWRDGCAGQSVVSVQWSQTRPAVFSVLDSASNIYLWDLLKNETKPVITEGMGKDRVTAMALFGDSEQRNTYSGVALAHESGKIQIQYFTSNLTVSSLSEVEKLTSLIEAI
ncbi:cytoplasmic dynein 2 intermediate chain 1 isoform X2 [Periophthalmus magnuspinnatus]|uniref:cytoplasmic dynein 2 intermediate chain 1 isoform X2 n=1 Tax=Periophthalmus magnuspinnatus TaxID=409849 RepID=UPI0024364907|nr:cytoplasmic dynein 2 intermediate chain 1 isoform X2 [Periophthalmus magnuspinnatus]